VKSWKRIQKKDIENDAKFQKDFQIISFFGSFHNNPNFHKNQSFSKANK